MQSALVMPPSWQKRDLADIPGTDPFVWHGVIHQIDANGMRREEPLPPKDPERFRIVVVGDSLTYGEGVELCYPASSSALQPIPGGGPEPRVRGYGSEDVSISAPLRAKLEPDLVLGVCLNDFERGDGSGSACLCPEADEDPHQANPGLEPDFYADLLADFEARYRRFGEDVAAMNALVTGSGLPPMVAMVLDQGPRLDGPGRQLALAAERQLRAAGIETVDSEDFYRRYDGTNLAVSRWEGHPNEEAHAIWASELADRIRQHPDLERFATGARIARDQQG